MNEAQAGMAAIFDELGLDIEVPPQLRPDMTDEDTAAAAARLADELRRAQEGCVAAQQTPRHEKAARAAEEQARRHEQLRKDSLGAVYRRLVKEVHPDLESDPAERERKSRAMQDITAAYSRGDLHALLQLELEWLDPAAGDAARLTRDKLRAYTEFLKQQATELEADVQSLRLHPRYAPLIVDGAFGLPVVIDAPRELERLNTVIAQLRSALERLSSRDALDEVRRAIREYPLGHLTVSELPRNSEQPGREDAEHDGGHGQRLSPGDADKPRRLDPGGTLPAFPRTTANGG